MSAHVFHPTNVDEYNHLRARRGIVIVKFGAEWCGPCQRIAPGFEQLSQQMPQYTFISVDIDTDGFNEHPDQKNVKSIPSFKIFKNNRLVDEFSGANLNDLVLSINKSV